MIERMIVVPVNGFGNRLRGLAAMVDLSTRLERPLLVHWPSGLGMPSDHRGVFDPSTPLEFIGADEFRVLTGRTLSQIHPYVSSEPSTRTTFLRADILGEQRFIADIIERESEATESRQLVVIAGNHFSPAVRHQDDAQIALAPSKQHLYRSLRFVPDVQAVLDAAVLPTSFNALHLRFGDRSRGAPSDSDIWAAVAWVANSSTSSGLPWFVASDSREHLDRWVTRLQAHDLETVVLSDGERGRDRDSGIHLALAEWTMLSRADSLVYFRHSTFATEAAVLQSAHGSGLPLRFEGHPLSGASLGDRARRVRRRVKNRVVRSAAALKG